MEERDVALGARTKPILGICLLLSMFTLDPRPGIPTMLVRIVYVPVVDAPRTVQERIKKGCNVRHCIVMIERRVSFEFEIIQTTSKKEE